MPRPCAASTPTTRSASWQEEHAGPAGPTCESSAPQRSQNARTVALGIDARPTALAASAPRAAHPWRKELGAACCPHA
eukprot:6730160-Alexandrium_andersonii.AAC.1